MTPSLSILLPQTATAAVASPLADAEVVPDALPVEDAFAELLARAVDPAAGPPTAGERAPPRTTALDPAVTASSAEVPPTADDARSPDAAYAAVAHDVTGESLPASDSTLPPMAATLAAVVAGETREVTIPAARLGLAVRVGASVLSASPGPASSEETPAPAQVGSTVMAPLALPASGADLGGRGGSPVVASGPSPGVTARLEAVSSTADPAADGSDPARPDAPAVRPRDAAPAVLASVGTAPRVHDAPASLPGSAPIVAAESGSTTERQVPAGDAAAGVPRAVAAPVVPNGRIEGPRAPRPVQSGALGSTTGAVHEFSVAGGSGGASGAPPDQVQRSVSTAVAPAPGPASAIVAGAADDPGEDIDGPRPEAPVLVPSRSGERAAPSSANELAPNVRPEDAPLPLRSPQFAALLHDRVVQLRSRGIDRANLTLEPAELGRLEIHVKVQGEAAHVSFVAQHAHARDVLEAQIPRLRTLLEASGLTLGDVDVGASADRGSRGDDPRPGTSPRRSAVTALDAPVVRRNRDGGLIDLHA